MIPKTSTGFRNRNIRQPADREFAPSDRPVRFGEDALPKVK